MNDLDKLNNAVWQLNELARIRLRLLQHHSEGTKPEAKVWESLLRELETLFGFIESSLSDVPDVSDVKTYWLDVKAQAEGLVQHSFQKWNSAIFSSTRIPEQIFPLAQIDLLRTILVGAAGRESKAQLDSRQKLDTLSEHVRRPVARPGDVQASPVTWGRRDRRPR